MVTNVSIIGQWKGQFADPLLAEPVGASKAHLPCAPPCVGLS